MASTTDPRSSGTDTPLRRQYHQLKSLHPNCVLLFQLGDFYESFEDDAGIVAQVCGIALTSREFGKGDRVALAGVPLGRLDHYLARLIDAGYHVAIAEQLSPPGAGLVERAITRVVTPGVVAEPGLLRENENNYLAAVVPGRTGIGFAYVDVSTGEFATAQLEGPDAETCLRSEVERLSPSEVLLPQGQELDLPSGVQRTVCQGWRFQESAARERLCSQLGVRSLEAFGCGGLPLATGAAGAILSYLEEHNPRLLPSLTQLVTYETGGGMALDGFTRRNLELLRNGRTGRVEGSLLGTLDDTRTPMGGRLLRRRLGQPLLDFAAIDRRLDEIDAFVQLDDLRGTVRTQLGRLGDLERLVGRISQTIATPRELVGLAASLRTVSSLQQTLLLAPIEAETGLDIAANHAREVGGALEPCLHLVQLVERAVALPESGRRIRPGYSAELDELEEATTDDRRWIASLEQTERRRTGIRTLKVGHNKVFGYYLEVTRPYLSQVPDSYQRRQTLVSAERFVTPELQERETRILRGEERFQQLEQELFVRLQREIAEDGPRLRELAHRLAELDVATTLAEVARTRGYCRPSLDESNELELVDARHPVVEATQEPGAFIPNDCRLGADSCQIMLVTGPNMAGKSTYLRQVAQIALLAQIGSFVPCRSARIGLVDRIFTRVGAQDDIAGGASTFMVEMMETASILRHATERSLVVLDEIGRGTSTFDGLAIAEAVIRETHEVLGARTLFATHFHELAELADQLPHLQVLNASVAENDGEVVFLRRIVPGPASRSYGVQVARLAGLPARVTERTARILQELEARAHQPKRSGPVASVGEQVSDLPGYAAALEAAARVFELTCALPEAELPTLAQPLRATSRAVCAALVAAHHARPANRDQTILALRERVAEVTVWIDLAQRCGYLTEAERHTLGARYAQVLVALPYQSGPIGATD